MKEELHLENFWHETFFILLLFCINQKMDNRNNCSNPVWRLCFHSFHKTTLAIVFPVFYHQFSLWRNIYIIYISKYFKYIFNFSCSARQKTQSVYFSVYLWPSKTCEDFPPSAIHDEKTSRIKVFHLTHIHTFWSALRMLFTFTKKANCF